MAEYHVFISYAHLDNVPPTDGTKGWISHFDDALKSFLGQWYDEAPQIWRDPKLPGNAPLLETVIGTVEQSNTLIAVVSPRYLVSEWCKDELEAFCKRLEGKSPSKLPIFKVLKSNVQLSAAPEIFRNLTGYQFIIIGENDKPRILNPDLGSPYKEKFFLMVSDLAYDISETLRELRESRTEVVLPAEGETGDGLFLALPPTGCWEQYHNIRRDLTHRKFKVLPAVFDVPKPENMEAFKQTVRENLRQSKLSVHILDAESIEYIDDDYIDLQVSLAAERDGDPEFSRLIWLGEDLQADDERVEKYISRVVRPASPNVDILSTTLEKFKTAILDTFSRETTCVAQPESSSDTKKVYVLYDKPDVDSARSIEEKLYDNYGCEILPASEYLFLNGDDRESKIIEAHNQYLRECDGVLIYWRSQLAPWVRAKLSDLQRAKGTAGRTDFRAKGVYMDGDLSGKVGFRTREAMILKSQNDLPQFVSQLNYGGQN